MNPLIVIIGVVVFVVIVFVATRLTSDKASSYKKKSLEKISRDMYDEETQDIMTDEVNDSFADSMRNVPILGKISTQLKLSGSSLNFATYMFLLIIVTLIITYIVGLAFRGQYGVGILVGIVGALMISNIYLGIKVEKRNGIFLDNFPDAIDIIVRSVKSGHPLLSALRTISQNAEPPISTEFQKVVDEVSYGSPLHESLRKMADRIGLLDINFFVVILSVQQETGGNLAEVLSNLSGIIRKRKQLRLKIRAMTAEGRLTSWIFAAIPFFQLGAVWFLARDYLTPLFTTFAGNVILVGSMVLIAFSIFISKKLSNIEV